jgi:hypothetical protein
MAHDRDGYEKIKYVGKENLEEDIGICTRTRNVENKNQSGIAGIVQRLGHCSRITDCVTVLCTGAQDSHLQRVTIPEAAYIQL